MHRKKKTGPREEKTERRGKVVLPYVKGVSEKLARVFKRYDIESIHKPSSTLKNLLCSKMKDQVDVLDRTGAVYYIECKKKECRQEREKDDYTGETDRVTRERMYEHSWSNSQRICVTKEPEKRAYPNGPGRRSS